MSDSKLFDAAIVRAKAMAQGEHTVGPAQKALSKELEGASYDQLRGAFNMLIGYLSAHLEAA